MAMSTTTTTTTTMPATTRMRSGKAQQMQTQQWTPTAATAKSFAATSTPRLPLQQRSRLSHTAMASSSSSPSSSAAATAAAAEDDATAADTAASSSSSPSSSTAPSEPDTLYGYFPSTLPDGPPPRGHFPIDTALLRREFLRLQAAHHPDKHPPGAPKTRAEASSAAINHAYRTLANPLLRAQYLLALRGVDVAADEALRADDQPALLAAVMDAHEAIEEAAGPHDLEPLRHENDARVADSERVLEEAFRRDDVDAAKREAVRLRYWVNIRDSIHNWEDGRPVVLQH
ncbi:Fe-S protein assembly co-chaperone HscB [Purpureocillium lavendulum]|uniref:Fe-S protein assembly co-chaperone HscB n=1 Tax=Purpureocillium lavendulum TaxID=1247861 RepID=A0AB34G2G6_9HYPO|nr:Fe-S protein assembly co-chaperone HscB [Purpureocillium lavendulum]